MNTVERGGLKLERAVDYIRTEFSRAGVEIVGCNSDAIHVTLPPEFDDISFVLTELKENFNLHADYRFCTETKLGMLILGYYDEEDRDETQSSTQLSRPGSEYASVFLGIVLAILSVLTTLFVHRPFGLSVPLNGTI